MTTTNKTLKLWSDPEFSNFISAELADINNNYPNCMNLIIKNKWLKYTITCLMKKLSISNKNIKKQAIDQIEQNLSLPEIVEMSILNDGIKTSEDPAMDVESQLTGLLVGLNFNDLIQQNPKPLQQLVAIWQLIVANLNYNWDSIDYTIYSQYIKKCLDEDIKIRPPKQITKEEIWQILGHL